MQHLRLVLPVLFALLLPSGIAPQPAPAAPQAAPLFIDAAPFGINSHIATRYPDPSRLNVPADIVAATGAGWVREDFQWHRIQPAPNTWNWLFFDEMVEHWNVRNIQIVGVIGPAVGWATPEPADGVDAVSFYAPDPVAYAAYAGELAARYRGRVNYWEIWNEPDHVHFWKPAPDPLAYAELLRLAAAAIRAAAPEARILIGGTSPFDTSFLETVGRAGGWESFDILAIHPYVDPLSPEEADLQLVLDRVQPLLTRYGQRPVWATEFGWASGPGDRDERGLTDRQAQADYLVRSLILLRLAGVERSFWYGLKDDPHNPYGLIAYGNGRDDFDPALFKPAYYAFQTVNRELALSEVIDLRDLFIREQFFEFELFGVWRRGDQPNGSLTASEQQRRSGRNSARLNYTFPGAGNDYVVFTRDRPLAIPGTPAALGLWVYGDGSGHQLRVWLRDAQGEVLQYTLGVLPAAGWHFLSTSLRTTPAAHDRINAAGNGLLDWPASVYALVLDDAPDAAIGQGTIYLDDFTALTGQAVYQVRLRRADAALDLLWSPDATRVALRSAATEARIVSADGSEQRVAPEENRLRLELSNTPLFIWHRR